MSQAADSAASLSHQLDAQITESRQALRNAFIEIRCVQWRLSGQVCEAIVAKCIWYSICAGVFDVYPGLLRVRLHILFRLYSQVVWLGVFSGWQCLYKLYVKSGCLARYVVRGARY